MEPSPYGVSRLNTFRSRRILASFATLSISLFSVVLRVAYNFKSTFAGELLTFVGSAKKEARSVLRKVHKFPALQATRMIIDAEGIEYGIALFR